MILFLVMPVQATEFARAFLDGVKKYKAENYGDAISEFTKITDAGVINGKLYYNLGNAYLKNGNVGYAILWYKRALKLIPGDPDLKFNHEYALTLVKDRNEDGRSSIFRVLFFWQHLLSTTAIQWTALIFNLIFWFVLILQMIRRKKSLKPLGHGILILALLFTLTAFYNFYASKYIKRAIILTDIVSVRSGLTEDSTELFVLHAGTKVRIGKESNGYFKIIFSDGKIGWLKKTEVGII